MDRAVFDRIEREIDDEVRARFPGDVIKQAVLLHYGDDPEIEPGELWVRVLLPADRPEDYEQILVAFERDHGRRCRRSRATWPKSCARSGWSSSPFPITPSPAGATVPGAA
jgi:hypothetical protein